MSLDDKLSEMILKLNSAKKERMKQERMLITQRNKEICINEEVTILKDENEFLLNQVKELNSQILQMQSQLAMINVCRASEESKVNVYISDLDHFKNEYDELFRKENQVINKQNEILKQRQAEAEEKSKQDASEIQEKNNQLAQEIAAVERECEAIEQECCVLTKRNKAIMLKLRKKLIETEDLRRGLMRNIHSTHANEMQE